MIVVTFEERIREFVAVDYLCRSIAKFEPGMKVIFATVPSLKDEAQKIVDQHDHVELRIMPERRWEFAIKTVLMQEVLQERSERPVVWMDSDIVACRPFKERLMDKDPEVFEAAEEYAGAPMGGSAIRCEKLGVKELRNFPRTVNGAMLSATEHHLPLLKAWDDRMNQPDYQEMQKTRLVDRPKWFTGDQCVLTVLLASQFSDLPVKNIASGRDIVHELPGAGYSFSERMGNLFHGHLPYFSHAIGDGKPWRLGEGSNISSFKRSQIQLSLYVHTVRQLLDPSEWPDYLQTTQCDAKVAQMFSLNAPHVKGLFHTAGYSAVRSVYRTVKRAS